MSCGGISVNELKWPYRHNTNNPYRRYKDRTKLSKFFKRMKHKKERMRFKQGKEETYKRFPGWYW